MKPVPDLKYKQNLPACQDAGRRNWPLLLGAGLLIAGAGVTLGTLAYAYSATHPRRVGLYRTPADYGLPFEEISFPSRDGIRLHGWLIPAPEHTPPQGVITLCHGYPQNRVEMLPYAEILRHAGYVTLLFDFRAMGLSEGDLTGIGHHEVEDLRGALDYLETRSDTAALPHGALGLSLGAAVAIMTAAQDRRLRAIVAEASYPTLSHALDMRFRAILGPLGPHAARPVRWWAKRWVPVEPEDVSPLEAMPQVGPCATLIIQGKRDLLVRWQDAVRLYEAASGPCELWLLERSGHARCLNDAPEEYAQRLRAFFNRHLPPSNEKEPE